MTTAASSSGSMFRSLRSPSYRLWASGAFVSNIGTWMQRTAQDWIVLTRLTHHDAVAVGITMALQFGPQVLFVPISGLVADRMSRRTLLMMTQAAMGLLALGLGLLSLSGTLTLAEVDVFAFLLGCAAAFDAPARQSWVSDLVGPELVTNAVALNPASFNSARLIGPAVAGFGIELAGAGWVFLLNAASFAAVIVALRFMRSDLGAPDRAGGSGRGLGAGFRAVAGRPDIIVLLTMVLLIGSLAMNFPIYATTMAVLFGSGAGAYGALSTALAAGAVAGALLAAKRAAPRFGLAVGAAALLGVGLLVSAAAPSYLVLALVLPLVGISAQTFLTTANGLIQLTTDRGVRGRVLAIYIAILLGGTVVGAPVIGGIANALGPRAGLIGGGTGALIAAVVGALWHARHPVDGD